MKTICKKASHLKAHTWRDIGGIGGLLLDEAFFVLLVVVSTIMTIIGFIGVALAYLFFPVIALLSALRNGKYKYVDETILLEDGTLGTRHGDASEESAPALAAKF